MNISTEVVGLAEVIEKIDMTNAAIALQTSKAIQAAGIKCQKFAKKLCPVDTGRLRNSILYHKTDKYSCTVDTNVSYSVYVELGTRRMAAQPYLTPAYEWAGHDLMAELSTWI